MSKKRVLIVGYPGQDGRLLFDLLSKRDCEVLALGRTNSWSNCGLILEAHPQVTDHVRIAQLVNEFHPDEIYYLAAYHSSSQVDLDSQTRDSFQRSFEVHALGIVNILELVAQSLSKTRVFYASSALIFGGEQGKLHDEKTPLTPQGIYGITKATGTWACRHYRENRGVHCCVGILFNHESAFRPPHFLSQKIIRAALSIAKGSKERLVIGDLNARVDWGYAPDYVDAFTRIMQLDEAQDYVVATGETHSAEEFVAHTFDYLGLDWREYVREDRTILSRKQPEKVGNPERLMRLTQWKPSMSFKEMVCQLVEDTRRLVNAMD